MAASWIELQENVHLDQRRVSEAIVRLSPVIGRLSKFAIWSVQIDFEKNMQCIVREDSGPFIYLPIPIQNPRRSETLILSSIVSASFLSTSALNLLKAISIRDLLSGSLLIVWFAELVPVKKPVWPPRNRLSALKKAYVATSPNVEGLREDVISGMALFQVSKWIPSKVERNSYIHIMPLCTLVLARMKS